MGVKRAMAVEQNHDGDKLIVPSSLQDLLGASQIAMRAHPQHALLPIRRWNIYINMGSIDSLDGRQRRARLALLAAHHVLPIWWEERPDDPRAEQLLLLADSVLHNTTDATEASERVAVEWWWLTDDDHGGRYEKLSDPVYFAYGAAIRASFVALGDDSWDSYRFTESESDADIDEASSDAAEWAANAVAGPIWLPDSDSTRRLAFWNWWLTEAVPTAWQQGDMTLRP